MNFAEKITKLVLAHGGSNKSFGKLVGISGETVRLWRNTGKSHISTATDVASKLGLNPEVLLNDALPISDDDLRRVKRTPPFKKNAPPGSPAETPKRNNPNHDHGEEPKGIIEELAAQYRPDKLKSISDSLPDDIGQDELLSAILGALPRFFAARELNLKMNSDADDSPIIDSLRETIDGLDLCIIPSIVADTLYANEVQNTREDIEAMPDDERDDARDMLRITKALTSYLETPSAKALLKVLAMARGFNLPPHWPAKIKPTHRRAAND